MSESSVNQIIVDIDNITSSGFSGAGIKDKTIIAPTGAGLTAKASLISKGWALTTD